MDERTQEYDLHLVGGYSTVSARAVVAVRDWTEGGTRRRTCSITLTWPGRAVDATSHSVYHAFQNLGLTRFCGHSVRKGTGDERMRKYGSVQEYSSLASAADRPSERIVGGRFRPPAYAAARSTSFS